MSALMTPWLLTNPDYTNYGCPPGRWRFWQITVSARLFTTIDDLASVSLRMLA
jgi:hypothetical protein